MNELPNACPFCGGELVITHLNCRECDTHIDGRFAANGGASPLSDEQQAFVERFVARLQPEQLSFVETFVRCEGKLKSMEAELGVSYPTIRRSLDEVVRALGYEPGQETGGSPAAAGAISEERRRSILEDLDSGKISAEEAMRLLGGEA